ncbi:hypothetical protein ISN45_At01g073330 [Arabidopsis thaliana x Arabidopsis arenosa]|uniref:Uncharacterized protein n=2 Tax=Arabidopsis TaxID=3701 RepID=A0A8T2HMV5_ARASU|nr:hypothetical protein ISN45_At01g073330 [Arabidopsis thaliana x Arabidopsis arenosa]KAG7660307.1 hypothetical protein ISN44_As01g070510 [Arabidopsis suecica]
MNKLSGWVHCNGKLKRDWISATAIEGGSYSHFQFYS